MSGEPIEIAYDLSIEDIHAFNSHYSKNAPLAVRTRRLARFALTFLLAALLVSLGVLSKAPIPFWLLGALILFAWYAMFPSRADQMLRRHTERTYAENPRGLLGPHRVRLEPEWVIEISELREVRTRWEAVDQVVVAGEHLFIYVTSFTAVIVPRRAFADAEGFQAFAEAARRIRGGRGEAPVSSGPTPRRESS